MSNLELESKANTSLKDQDLDNLDVSQLTPLTPEVISRQATINIGTIGHVAHGKSTIVRALSGVQTVRFKSELERNITIKLERLTPDKIRKLCNSREAREEYEAKERMRLRSWKFALRAHHLYGLCCDESTFKRKSLRLLFSRQSSVSSTRSPSSGYVSCNSNSIPDDRSERTPTPRSSRTNNELDRKTNSNSHKRNSNYNGAIKNNSKTKPPRGEYIIESICSVELVDLKPLFFVKWLNYPQSTNTWEQFGNLKDTRHLDEFVSERRHFYETTIADIVGTINEKILDEALEFDKSKLNIPELDSYDPLQLDVDLIILAQLRRANSKSIVNRDFVFQRAIYQTLMLPLYYKRKEQLAVLKEIETRINQIEVAAPLKVENLVDFDVIEPNFEYIENNIYGKNVPEAPVIPPGCNCLDNICVPSSKCCARLHGSFFAYEKNGRLRLYTGSAVYECNKSCSCDETCVNRVIERGRKNQLTIFKTSNGCGWGVRTRSTIRRGDFVCEYVGEIITTDEANVRGELYDEHGRTYLFDLDYTTDVDSVYTIDAAVVGNVSHFINHSCDPNCAVFPLWKENYDPNMPRLVFFALRTIVPGEELTFDYIRDSDNDSKNEYKNLSNAERVPCRCGAANCRKQLF